MYDPLTDTWTRKASMPTARSNSAAVTAHDRIYVVGGRTPETGLATVEEYDPVRNAWTRRMNIWSTNPRISVPLFAFGAKEVKGRIYAIGGASDVSNPQGLSHLLEYIPPVIFPELQINRVKYAANSVLRLEWLSAPDYLDVLQSRNQLPADDWTDVEKFSGTGGTQTREIPAVDAASFYRLQRAL